MNADTFFRTNRVLIPADDVAIKTAVIIDESRIVEAANLAHEAFGLSKGG